MRTIEEFTNWCIENNFPVTVDLDEFEIETKNFYLTIPKDAILDYPYELNENNLFGLSKEWKRKA